MVMKILTSFIATYASILISSSSSTPRSAPSAVARTLPYHPVGSVVSAVCLQSRKLSAQDLLTSELLRTL